jgi:hypothetical protein
VIPELHLLRQRNSDQDRSRPVDQDHPDAAIWSRLTPELETMLTTVVEHTRGKKALIVGGKPREVARIQVFLEYSHVEWPDLEPHDSLAPLFRKLNQVDQLLVCRFCRKACKRLIREARSRALSVVYLPHGYSLHQVIYQSYRQLRHA